MAVLLPGLGGVFMVKVRLLRCASPEMAGAY